LDWKQFLTEKVLGECWDADKRPGGDKPNRTFDNRNDLLDLYEAVNEDGKWSKFIIYTEKTYCFQLQLDSLCHNLHNFTAWLFCLDKTGYKERCKMGAEFCGWEGEK